MRNYEYRRGTLRAIGKSWNKPYIVFGWGNEAHIDVDSQSVAEYRADFEMALRAIKRTDWLKGKKRLTFDELNKMVEWLNKCKVIED